MILKMIGINMRKMSAFICALIPTIILVQDYMHTGYYLGGAACIVFISVACIGAVSSLLNSDFGGDQTSVYMTLPVSAGEILMTKGIAFAAFAQIIPMLFVWGWVYVTFVKETVPNMPVYEDVIKGMFQCGIGPMGAAVCHVLLFPAAGLFAMMIFFMVSDGVISAAGNRQTNKAVIKLAITAAVLAGACILDVCIKLVLYNIGLHCVNMWVLLAGEQALIAGAAVFFYRDCKNRLETKCDLG